MPDQQPQATSLGLPSNGHQGIEDSAPCDLARGTHRLLTEPSEDDGPRRAVGLLGTLRRNPS